MIALLVLSGCAATEAESIEDAPIAATVPKPKARSRRRSASGNVLGTLRFKIGDKPLALDELLKRTGWDELDVEIAGTQAPLEKDGRFGLQLDPGNYRLDHLVAVRQENEHVLFIPPVVFAATPDPEPGCLGTFELSFGSLSELTNDGFPSERRSPDCGPDRPALAKTARAESLPELADPIWLALLGGVFASESVAITNRAQLVPGFGLRYPLARDPGFLGSFWLVGRLTLWPTIPVPTAAVEWGPWQGWTALSLQGGLYGSNPQVGVGLVAGPIKREVTLAARVDVQFVSGFAPAMTYSLVVDLAPVALVGSIL